MPQGRFRADLVDVGWAPEHTYGTNPPTAELGTDELGLSNKALSRQWGIVNGGINLPNPTFAWTPFFGVGVDSRNMLFPIQGQETLEGGIPSAMLCHDSSRMAFEQMYGLIFNAWNVALTVNNVVTNLTATWGMATAAVNIVSGVHNVTLTSPVNAQGTSNMTLVDFATMGGVSSGQTQSDPPTHIILIGSPGESPNPWDCTWAYIGPVIGSAVTGKVNVYQDRDLAISGWNGKPPGAGGSTRFSVHSILRDTGASLKEDGVFRGGHATDPKTVYVRPTLVQPSFVLGAKFRADDGGNFLTNYTGCKVSRFTISMDEGAPVTFNYDFIAQDMRHNIGEDDGTGSANDVARYLIKGTGASNTLDVTPMRTSRVVEQPYFFSGADIQLHGTSFARLRSFSISVDNALDPRYYVTQNAGASATIADRQILYEILEGRRTITVSGSIDMDNTGSPTHGGGGKPTDAKLLQYVLNQGFMDNDQRNMQSLQGISIVVELRKIKTAGGSSAGHDKIRLTLPDPGQVSANQGSTGSVGLYLNSAGHAIPAPPSVHIPVDFDGAAASMGIEFLYSFHALFPSSSVSLIRAM